MRRPSVSSTAPGALAGAAGLLLSLAFGPPAAADEYDFVYVDAFQSGYDLKESYLFDLNNLGQGCGLATDLPTYSGFSWSVAADKTRIAFTLPRGINDQGKIAGLDKVLDTSTGGLVTIPLVPGAVHTPVALDINDQDVVVGYAETCHCSNSDHSLQIPFVWDAVNGSRSIPVPGAKELVKVNNFGVAVGNIRGGSPDGFVYDLATGETTRMSAFLPTNPYPWTEAAAINDLGMVTGIHRSDDAESFHGYVWTRQAGAALLPHLAGDPALDVRPWAINDQGIVVGMAEVANHVWHAFAWDLAHGIRDLNALVTPPAGFILDRALGINDRGWIVGDGHFGPNWSSSQAFVLIPRDAGVLAVAPLAEGIDLRVRPNPARGAATIEYRLTAPGPVRMLVYDLGGRRIAERLEAERPAGTNVVHWDGRDLQGRAVPPGAYVVRLETADRTLTSRLAILR